jgi:hypothetical protein
MTGRTTRLGRRFGRALPGILFLSAAVLPQLARADSFPYTGTFATDDQVQLFNFTLATTEEVTFQTWSYGGGTNAADAVIDPGGFESLLTWFAPDGSLIGDSSAYGCGSGNIYQFDCLDAYADPTLGPGTYTLALTVWDNSSLGDGNAGDLALGFQYAGQPNFTAVGLCTAFCDSDENQDNGNWSVDIVGADSASLVSSTPEPVTMLLAGCGLFLVGLAKYRCARGKQA